MAARACSGPAPSTRWPSTTATLNAGEIAEHHASHGLNRRPHATLTATPNPVETGTEVSFDASASADPDGSIASYQWDLDGNGSFETDTGTTATAKAAYAQEGDVTVTVRVRDDETATDTESVVLTVADEEEPPPPPPVASYSKAVAETPGLIHYWRFSETAGTTLADSAGSANAGLGGGTALGVAGALGGGAGGFDGLDDYAAAPVDLSGTTDLTVEFWLKWNAYADDDDLAMELTENFNANEGGLLIDPNSSQEEFGVGMGSPETRNNVYFARPSAGAWHHYAFVFDTTAAAAQQITPYVDGKAVAFSKGASGTGSGAFANSSLYFMSRAGANLFGAGSLDEVAVYDQPLSAAQVAAHFAANAD